jgi:hypothetical protein
MAVFHGVLHVSGHAMLVVLQEIGRRGEEDAP